MFVPIEIITNIVVEFTSATYSESESAGEVVIDIVASRPTNEVFTIFFSTEDNSATCKLELVHCSHNCNM